MRRNEAFACVFVLAGFIALGFAIVVVKLQTMEDRLRRAEARQKAAIALLRSIDRANVALGTQTLKALGGEPAADVEHFRAEFEHSRRDLEKARRYLETANR